MSETRYEVEPIGRVVLPLVDRSNAAKQENPCALNAWRSSTMRIQFQGISVYMTGRGGLAMSHGTQRRGHAGGSPYWAHPE
jgi:hypothetical protein